MEERDDLVKKQEQQKKLFKNTWKEQMKIKDQERIINDELLKEEKLISKLK